jgi:NifU-like protein involved in Fe-S cluster formation
MAEISPLDEHFRAPRNAGILEGADLSAAADNPVCGDTLRLTLRRGPDGRVEACKFQAYGCPAAIAAGSLLTEMLCGASREAAAAITRETIARALGGLGSDKIHAAVLAVDAVRAALTQWR